MKIMPYANSFKGLNDASLAQDRAQSLNNPPNKTEYRNSTILPGYNASFGMAMVDREEIEKTNESIKYYTTPNCYGNLVAHNANAKQLKVMNEALKNQPKVLAQIYTTKANRFGNLVAHLTNSEGLRGMNEALKDQPKVLAQIYTTKNDRSDNLPAHYAGPEGLEAMNEGLKDQPKVLAQIYTTKKAIDEDLLAHMANAKELKVMNEGLKDQPKVLAQIYTAKDAAGRLVGYGASDEKLNELKEVLKKLVQKGLSEKESVNLLETNKDFLDDDLKTTLELLKKKK